MPPHEQAFLLFKKYAGRSHDRIQQEMRQLGYERFSRRSLYSYTRNGERRPGWIERYNWKEKCRSPHVENECEQIHRDKEDEMDEEASGGNPTCSEGVTEHGTQNMGSGIRNAATTPPTADTLPFPAWLRSTAPDMQWDARHQKIIYEQLARITSGELKRLMIFMPPRHGKSELVTIRYAAWRLRRDPKMRVVIGSYNQHLADKFSRSIRRVLSDEEDKAEQINTDARDKEVKAVEKSPNPAPDKREHVIGAANDGSETPATSASSPSSMLKPGRMFPRSRNINTMSEWETAVGGGVKAVGVGAGITGFGAELVIIDDPVKSRAQAESVTFRDRIWDWFRDDVCTRLEPDAPMILIQTRWHEDDLAGRILNEMKTGGEQWHVLSLPAIAESKGERMTDEGESEECGMGTKGGNPTGREGVKEFGTRGPEYGPDIVNAPPSSEPHHSSLILHPSSGSRRPGEALWPERFPAPALLERKERIGSYSFASLYQQDPSPAEGGHFKREWFRRIVDAAPPGLRWFRGYDLAVSTKTTADFTASFRVAFGGDGTYYIADGYRKRMEFPEQRRYVVGRMTEEKNTSHGVESALHGAAIVQDIGSDRRLAHIPLKDVKVDSDKLTRALGWANHAEAGKIALVRGGWIGEFIEELAAFPNGRHDDQIDAVSLAFRMLAESARNTTAGF